MAEKQQVKIKGLETLIKCLQITWDGDLISKLDRDDLVNKGLIVKSNGYNIISAKGIEYLDQLGIIHFLKIAKDLEKGTIDTDKAQSLLLGLFSLSHNAIDHLKKIVRIYEMGKAGTPAISAQGQAMDGYTQLANYNDLAEKAKKIIEHCA